MAFLNNFTILKVTGKFRGIHNPYDLGCAKNCLSMLCSPKKPRYMHYQMKAVYSLSNNLNYRRPSPQRQPSSPPVQDPQSPRREDSRGGGPLYEELDVTTSSMPRTQTQQNASVFVILALALALALASEEREKERERERDG